MAVGVVRWWGWRWLWLAAAVGSVVLGACTADDRRSVDLSHIHGLGINPADGQLYVASHHGIFRLTDKDEPEQVAGRTQDFMGFTIVGPNRFLGSGHPGAGDRDQPPHLGLIETTDGAQSWRSVSLSGLADFHAMDAKHGRVYGYDSQTSRLLVSADMRTWDRRASGAFIDIAVSPDNADEVLATTTQGLTRSIGGGRSFTPVQLGAALVLIDWPRTDFALGVAADGTVYASENGGTQWIARGQVPGGVQAMTTAGDSQVYVATQVAIYRSPDSGASFEAIHLS